MKKSLLLIAGLLALVPLRAQRPVVQLTMDSCAAWALQSQAAMKNALLDIGAAKETRRAAFTKYFPSASLMAGGFHAYRPLIDKTFSSNDEHTKITASFDGQTLEEQMDDLQNFLDLMGVRVNLQQMVQDFVDRFSVEAQVQMLQHGIFANAMVTQPVFAGGRIVNGNRLAAIGVQAAELRLVMTRDEVELNVASLFWQIVSLDEKQKTVAAAARLLDTLERDAEAAVEGGLMSRNDLLKVRLKQSELKAAATQLTNGRQLAAMALCQYMGKSYDSADYRPAAIGLEPAPPLPLLADPRQAAERRVESSLLDLSVEAARLQGKMAAGEALPQAALGATYGANNLLGDQFTHNGLVFATLSVPLTGWWEGAHKIKKEQLALRQAENTRRDLQEKMVLQIRQAQNELAESYSLIAVRSEAVGDAQENYAEVRNYFDAGMATMKELLEAQTMLQQALNDRTDQLIDYRLKTIRYAQLTR